MKTTTTEEPTTEQTIKEDLQALIARVKPEIFTAEAQTSTGDNEVLGCIVSKFTEWTPQDIFEIAIYALEDANAHEFTADLIDLGKKHGFTDPYDTQATLDEAEGASST